MKELSIKIIDLLICKLTKLQQKLVPFKISEDPDEYYSLTPTAQAENIQAYEKALVWALNKGNQLRNIAITGTYGSGKSSFINTFFEKHKIKYCDQYINISLATFKEFKTKEKTDESNGSITVPLDKKNIDSGNTEQLRSIELSILQQIFYHEKDSKIPDSRFRKIKKTSNKRLLFTSFWLLALTNSLLYKFSSSVLDSLSVVKMSERFSGFFEVISSIIILISSALLIYKVLRYLRGITISKFKIQNAEIQVNEDTNKSILNHHLDEILYFFEVTDNRIVVIEDVDRFEQTEIFTKLREINFLINQSKKVSQNVVFIYAVKDEMFKDKDRTKFFDFIIPIVPVINTSNSLEKLLAIRDKFQYQLSNILLEDISLFIDDMRLLSSIANEFQIYHNTLSKDLKQEKLLGIIVYKNLFPEDFYRLSQGEGSLYKFLTSKNELIKDRINKLDSLISEVDVKIDNTKQLGIDNLSELRLLYIQRIQNIAAKNPAFHQFYLDRSAVSLEHLVQEDMWQAVVEGRLAASQNHVPQNQRQITYDFSKIEIQVDSKKTYKERAQILEDNSQLNVILQEKVKLSQEKEALKKKKLKDVVTREYFKIGETDIMQENLLFLLIRNGYVDEDYFTYMSLFYEGSLTRSDYQFLINVKSELISEFEHNLFRIDNLARRIRLFDFEKEYTLNYQLTDYLLEKEDYAVQLDKLISQLSNESRTSIKFLDGYLSKSKNPGLFIKKICANWHNIWDFISTKEEDFVNSKNDFLKLILKYSRLSDIEAIFANSLNFLESEGSPILSIENEHRTRQVIETLGLEFKHLPEDISENLMDFILDNNYYSILPETLKGIISFKGEFDKGKFEKSNWSFIQSTSIELLKSRIDDQVNEYVENVFLKLPENVSESEATVLKLLSFAKIRIKNKGAIVSQSLAKIRKLSNVETDDVLPYIFSSFKAEPTWPNMLYYFDKSEQKISAELVSYLDSESIYKTLSQVKIPETKVDDKTTYGNLSRKLIEELRLSDVSYHYLTKSIPWWYSDLNIKSLSIEKVRSLISNMVLQPSAESLELITNTEHADLFVELIEKHENKYTELIDEINIDSDELFQILSSGNLSLNTKQQFMDSCESSLIEENWRNLELLAELRIKNKSFNLGDPIKKAILLNTNISIENRISLFVLTYFFEHETIEDFLKGLGSPYEIIANKDRKAKLPKSTINEQLLFKLESVGYISSYSVMANSVLRVNHKRN